jgi:hypothetical protein
MKKSKRDAFLDFISGKEIHFLIGLAILCLTILGACKW